MPVLVVHKGACGAQDAKAGPFVQPQDPILLIRAEHVRDSVPIGEFAERLGVWLRQDTCWHVTDTFLTHVSYLLARPCGGPELGVAASKEGVRPKPHPQVKLAVLRYFDFDGNQSDLLALRSGIDRCYPANKLCQRICPDLLA